MESESSNLFETVCGLAAEYDASDILLHEGQPAVLRIRGELVPIEGSIATTADFVWLRKVCKTADDLLDFDGSYVAPSGDRYRVNILRQMGRHATVMRRIRGNVPDMEALGLPVDVLQGWLSNAHGIILIAGRTGSGKSTTLASCINWINNKDRKHIVTIEDPVEYVFTPAKSVFTQREVGLDTPSFAQGLKRSLRQCPDIILVGEIRDADTAMTALQAAETGHLVLSTVHAASCSEVVERIQNVFPVEQRDGLLRIFSQCLIGSMCQTLLPAVDGGLALATEYFSNQGLAPKLIAEGRIPELVDFIQRSGKETGKRLIDSLAELCQTGRITQDTAMSFAPSPQELQRVLQGVNSGSGVSRR
ncbi:MAG: ATPase, T2SS/T4P/T4SS family [Chthoniobacterales bacterium]